MYIIDDRRFGSRLRDFGLCVLRSEEMTRSLECLWPGWNTFSPDTTLFVIPGNGARDVERGLETRLRGWPTVRIQAQRQWVPGEAPRALVNRIYPPGFLLGFRDVVIVDDVIASGVTTQAVKRMNEPWIPGVKWHLLSWVMQRSANTAGFSSAFAAFGVGEKNGRKPPINSLSTLLDQPSIARNYAVRNFPDRAERFLDQLARL